MRATYLDSSALVKLAVAEPESVALRRYLRRCRPLVSSALARTEVLRALLRAIELVRVNDPLLDTAGELQPDAVRSLDAIHLATALLFGKELGTVVTYDERMANAAGQLGFRTHSPK